MVLEEDGSGGGAATSTAPHTADDRSRGRTRKCGTFAVTGPFQNDCNLDKHAEKAGLSYEEDGESNLPDESASSSCDLTDSIKSSPTRISLSLSCGGGAESFKSESPDVQESSRSLNDSNIPTIKIVQSSSLTPSAEDISNPNYVRNSSVEDRNNGHNDSWPGGNKRKFVPPDGGYGWVVVVAACLANVWIIGFLRSYSILYMRIMLEYGDSAYQTSWIHALLTTTGFLLGPITGLLCRKYGARSVSIAGGLCAFSGIFLSSFATSIMPLIFTLGLLTGLGVGFVSTPGILIVNLYFEKHRGIACAFCMSGNAIGAFLMPPLLQYLLLEYGLRGTLLISSGMQLHILVSAFLFRPTEVHTRIQELDRKRAIRSARDKGELPRTLDHLDKEKKWSNLTVLQPADTQKPSSRLTSVDPELKEKRDSLASELSSYRSVPLTASVPNLKEFRESLINMQVWREETVINSNNKDNKPSFQHIASEEESVRPTRKRSSSECQYTDRPLDFDLSYLESLDTTSGESPKSQSEQTKPDASNEFRARKISLRRLVINKPVSARDDGTAQNLFDKKGPESVDEDVGLNGPNASLPLLGNLSEGSETRAKCDNGSLKRTSTRSLKITPEIQKSTVKEDFKLFAKAIAECFDMRVLKSKSMIIMGLSASLYSMGVPQALFYLHAIYTSVGMHVTEVTSLLSITAVCDICGRLSIGFIADTNYFRLSYLICACVVLASAGALSVPSTSTLVSAAVAMGCYSFGVGSFIVLLPTILAKNHGIDRLPATYGFIRLAMGLTTFIAPQVIGVLVDATGSYLPPYYLMGACMALGGILLLFMPPPPSEPSSTSS